MTTRKHYINQIVGSDVLPLEIIRWVSDKTVDARGMESSENKTKLHFASGGFAGHCTNQDEQRYDYASDPSRPVIRVRLNKTGWRDKHNNLYVLEENPRKFHDFNF